MAGCDAWYHIYPLGFLKAEEVNPTPGEVEGAIAHRLEDLLGWLDYLESLGITGLLLGPVFESESHGYDLIDPFRVDRRLGLEKDLVTLVEECHRRSIRVGLDLVLNHVGHHHPHFLDVVAHRQHSTWCDWFEIDFNQPGTAGFRYSNFEGHDHLVKLNHASTEVLKWAIDVARFWIDRGIDAFRIDAAYAIGSHFLFGFMERVRELRPDIFIVSEVIHGDYARFANDTQMPAITQYELWKAIWSSLNDRNFFELEHALQRHGEFCNHFTPWNFVGNHDTTRIFSQLTDSRYLFHALAVLLTLPGVPAIYAGDEQCARGNKYHRAGGDAEVRRPPPYRPAELRGDALICWQLHCDLLGARRKRPWIAEGKLRITYVSNRFISYEVSSGSQRLVAAFSTDQTVMRVENVGDLVQVAGNEANLRPHGWGIWASPLSGS